MNNVGDSYLAKFDQLSEEQWEGMWQLNVMSFVRAIQAVLPGMRERQDGVIVNVSSTAGKRPSTGMPNYTVTKAAVLSLSRLVADLYAKEGIRCNAIAPGPTLSDTWLARRAARGPAGGADREVAGGGVGGGRGRTSSRPDGRARGDRGGHRLPVLAALVIRDRRRLER